MDQNTEQEEDQKKNEINLDENYFKQHPQYWKKPQKIVADRIEDSLEKISSLNNGALLNLFSCFDLDTLIKLLQINKALNKIIKRSETLKKFLDVKEEYVENRGKPNQRLNFVRFQVTQLLKNDCELYAKFGKKYKVNKTDSRIIFGELLKRQIIREYSKARAQGKGNYFNLNDLKLKEYGISLLNYAVKDIPFFRKIVISGNKESINNFNLIKSFVNYSKKNLLSVNFSRNSYNDVIGANIFASIGINCPNIQIINVTHNLFTYSTFNHKKVKTAFELGYKNLSKLMLGNNILGTRGFIELCGLLKNCPKLNLLDVSYNGIDKNIFDNENVAELFGESLPYLYTFYYEGNYLPTSEIQNLVKHILSNNSLTYLYLQNNQIGDDSLEILAFLLSKNYNIHTLDLSYNKFTSKGVSKLCEGIMSKDTRLIEISLANNNLDETSLTYLADAITNSEQLYSVNLSYNNFSKGNCGMIIADMIKKDTKLKNVNLVACHLGLKTKEIFAALEENQTITFIDLSVNDIGNNLEMFKGLAKMLQKNKNIKYLYLDTNYITDRDFDIIINEGITKSVNLNYLSLKSNKITLSSIKRLSDSIKKDNRKLLEQYLKNLKKPKKDVNFFLRTSYQTDVLVRDYKYLEIIEAELQEKGILNSVKFNDHLKIIMLDDNPINDKESLIKLNTVLKFNGSNIPKNN
jgi:Ran GTPase-activating protein (RanGAP) involved in mRNA processing and transport